MYHVIYNNQCMCWKDFVESLIQVKICTKISFSFLVILYCTVLRPTIPSVKLLHSTLLSSWMTAGYRTYYKEWPIFSGYITRWRVHNASVNQSRLTEEASHAANIVKHQRLTWHSPGIWNMVTLFDLNSTWVEPYWDMRPTTCCSI